MTDAADPDDDARPAPAVPAASLADVLALCRAEIAPALIDDHGHAVLGAILARIPAALSPFWGVEVRLGDPAPRVDVLWEVTRIGRGRDVLAGTASTVPETAWVDALAAEAPLWRHLRSFAARWQRDRALDPVRNLWMEVDAASVPETADIPADAARLRASPSLFWGHDATTEGGPGAILEAMPALARTAYGLALDTSAVERLLAVTPEGAHVFQYGIMGGRSEQAVRLCVRGAPVSAVPDWLGRIGWPGDRAALDRLLDGLAAVADRIIVDIDLFGAGAEGRIGPKLGLELYRDAKPAQAEPWRPLLDRLAADGLARADKVAGCLAFPGERRTRVSLRASGIAYPLVRRSINHVKLVVAGARPVEAKAYLGVFRPGVDLGAVAASDGDETEAWLVR